MDRGRPGISQEEEPEGEQPMDEVSQVSFIRTSVTLTLHEAFFMFTLAPLGHAPPYGADNDHKKSAAFSCAIPPCSLLFPAIPCYSLLFPAIPVLFHAALHGTGNGCRKPSRSPRELSIIHALTFLM